MTPPHTSPDAPARLWLDLGILLDPVGVFDSPPQRSQIGWRRLYRFATGHLVAPTLYARLAACGRLDWVPDEIRDALQVLHQLNAEHNQRLRVLLRETTGLLNAVGIEPIALKGAIALLPGQYRHAEARVLGDLDLGIGEADLPAAFNALKAAGFDLPANIHPWYWSQTDLHHHAPPLMHPSKSGYVELHRALLNARVPAQTLSLDRASETATRLDWEGVQLRVPSIDYRLIHNSLHHQVSDRAFASDCRSLRQLLEFAQLRVFASHMAIDWLGLLAHLDTAGVGDALRLDLLAGFHLFGQPLPDGVRPSPAALAAEGRFWYRMSHPRLDRWMDRHRRAIIFARRVPNLPRRLLSPGWIRTKILDLRYAWSGYRGIS